MSDHHREDEARWVAAMRQRHARGQEHVCGLADVLRTLEERDEARAEVERLRGERDEARATLERCVSVQRATAEGWRLEVEELASERDEARAEVERLRSERDEAREHTSTAAFMRVERQRDEAKRNAIAWADERDAMRRQRDEARAEVRVLLAEIDAERRERASAVLAAVEAAEERGAEWMLAHAQSEVWSKDDYGVQWQDVRSPAEICRDARLRGR